MSSLVSSRPERPIRLHRFAPSGHCHRMELLLSLLDLRHGLVDVDLAAKEHKSARIEAVPRFVPMPRSP